MEPYPQRADDSRFVLFRSDGGIRVRREVDEVLHPSFLMPAAHACRSSVMIFGWSGSVQQDVLK